MDATVNQEMLPHLTQLTSFQFRIHLHSVARSVWASFLVNNIKLTDMTIEGIVTEETMLYLSSFSGLKKLDLVVIVSEKFKNMFFAEVLPKHVNSLQVLRLGDRLVHLFIPESVFLPLTKSLLAGFRSCQLIEGYFKVS
jgi:hypothetical protein